MALHVDKIGQSTNRAVLELSCNDGDTFPTNQNKLINQYIPNGSTLMVIGSSGIIVYFYDESNDTWVMA